MNGVPVCLSRRNYYHLSVLLDGEVAHKVLPCVVEVAEQELAAINEEAAAHLEELRALLAQNIEDMRLQDDPGAAPGARKRKLDKQVLTGKSITLSYSWRNDGAKFHVLLPSGDKFYGMEVLPQVLVLRLSLEKATKKVTIRTFFKGEAGDV